MKISRLAAAIGAAVGVGAVVTIVGSTAMAAGPDPAPRMQTKYVYCTTDSDGMCTVRHGLGVQPESVIVTPNIVGTNSQFDLHTVRYTWTAESFTVRAMLDAETPAANRQGIAFSFVASAPSGSSSRPTTRPEPTTEPEPTREPTPSAPPSSSDPLPSESTSSPPGSSDQPSSSDTSSSGSGTATN